jgi:hypothetical protein
MASDARVTEEYRNHQLLSAFHEGKYQGRAWCGKSLVLDVEGTGIADVLSLLKAKIDQQYSNRIIVGAVPPSAAAYIEAFRKIYNRINENQFAMLRAHYLAPGHCLTTTALADVAGYKDIGGVNLWYGFLGQWLFENMTVPVDILLDHGVPVYTSVLASWIADPSSPPSHKSHYVWKLHDAVVQAIEEMGLDK